MKPFMDGEHIDGLPESSENQLGGWKKIMRLMENVANGIKKCFRFDIADWMIDDPKYKGNYTHLANGSMEDLGKCLGVNESLGEALDTPRRLQFHDYLNLIEGKNGEACRKMYADHKEKFEKAGGSSVKHQAWEGGYIDHMEQILGLATDIYPVFTRHCGTQPFSLSDAYLTLFLHDIEKPWKYAGTDVEKEELASYNDDVKAFMMQKVQEYGIELTPEHLNALKYVHGEGEDYDPKRNVMNPLAAFIHSCDTLSARGGHNFPPEGMRFIDRKK